MPLGPQFEAGDVRRRAKEIQSSDAWTDANEDVDSVICLRPFTWLAKSSRFAQSHIYAGEVTEAVEAAAAAARASKKVETVDLSEESLKAAGELSQRRAAFAARRLAGIFANR